MSENENNQIKWAIHETHPEIVEHVREKLSEVIDPEIGMSIIQLGLVRELEIENDIARMKEVAIDEAEAAIQTILDQIHFYFSELGAT